MPFYVVDGQHRILALKKLIEEFGPEWRHHMLPFVCLIGADEGEEMDQFYIVNSKAKSVRTDLAYALLKQRAERDPSVMEHLFEKGKDWQVRAEELVEQLGERGAVWRGLIRFAGADKGETTMPSASIVTSLRPVLMSPFFGQLGKDQQVNILDAFWRGLRDVFPEPFDKPSEFVLQKGMGVMVLHAVLVHVLEIARSRGSSVTEPETYTPIMQDALENLQGENGSGETVAALDFWRVAPEGAAGSYSSSAGRRVLIAKIRQGLPNIEVV